MTDFKFCMLMWAILYVGAISTSSPLNSISASGLSIIWAMGALFLLWRGSSK